MRVPVLAYHSNNISGNDYASNDHVALAEDLRMIQRSGLRIVPQSSTRPVWSAAVGGATNGGAMRSARD